MFILTPTLNSIFAAERFARMQIIVGVVHLLKDFSFELSPKTKLPLEIMAAGGGLIVKGGIWMKCRPVPPS